MVGYRENDTITPNQKLIAGCLSGCLTRFLVQPMDVIKIRAQVQKQVKKGSLLMRIAGRIFKEEGATTFWHGHVLGQLHSILSMGVQFYSYELSTKYTDHLFDEHHKMVQKFLCGVFSGCSVTTSVMPIEVIRVRQILIKEQYKSLYSGAKAVYKTGGIKAFYEGLSASLLMMGPGTGLAFLVFTTVQPLFLKFLPEIRNKEKQEMKKAKAEPNALDMLLASSISASIAALISKTVTYPLDLIKRRLQLGSHKTSESIKVPSQAQNIVKCTKLIECFKTTFRKTGIRGFYTGCSVALLKAQLTMIISFTTYEMLCHSLRLSAK